MKAAAEAKAAELAAQNDIFGGQAEAPYIADATGSGAFQENPQDAELAAYAAEAGISLNKKSEPKMW